MKWILAKFTKEWTQNSIEYATQKKIIKNRELCKKDNEARTITWHTLSLTFCWVN